ncbi:MAG: hypothetical protein WCP29_09050 [Acidobacteriota bacterium]
MADRVVAFIQKPCSIKALAAKVRETLDKRICNKPSRSPPPILMIASTSPDSPARRRHPDQNGTSSNDAAWRVEA